MCGIVAVVRPLQTGCRPELDRSLDALRHRGPNDRGISVDRVTVGSLDYSVALGHVRLAILDLTAKGRQPMQDRGGSLIVHNGEIYNYRELRAELVERGHLFETGTDTEVILAAFREWGEACTDRFIGMWALAIWDGTRLFVSRDRLGEKPLYYFANRGVMAFASEIGALRRISGVTWRPDEITVFRYLAFADMEGKGSTFFSEIKEFPAGSSASLRPGGIAIEPRRYWHPGTSELDIDETEAVDQTMRLLIDSLSLRLRSDVPVGLSVSGGLDSTLLLALMNEAGYDRVPVFSITYGEHGFSETHYRDIATSRLDCQCRTACADAATFTMDFERFIARLGQPSRLPGPYSLWRVLDLANRHVKVLLDGQGADELAGGYLHFLPQLWCELSARQRVLYLPGLLLTLMCNRQLFAQYPADLIAQRLRGAFRANANEALSPPWSRGFRDERPSWHDRRESGLNASLRRSVLATSLPSLLRYGDHVSMAFGVENRSPFLDHRLVELVMRLPSSFKIRGGTTKWVFRQVAKDLIPRKIRKRRSKMGFPTPIGAWLGSSLSQQGKRWLAEYSANPNFLRWIDIEGANRLIGAQARGKGENQALLWRILSVGAWLKTNDLQA